MTPLSLSADPPPGVVAAIEAAGIIVVRVGGVWHATDDAASAAETIIAAHDPLTAARDAKLAELAALRYEREIGGFVWNGLTIDTSREARGNLSGAVQMATISTEFSVSWKTPDGTFVDLDSATLIALGQAVAGHVSACFTRERQLRDALLATAEWQDVITFDVAAAW